MTCLIALLSGCGSEAIYTEESFATDSPFALKVEQPVPVACESARRSLLGQGYLIDTTSGEQVKGRKAYRRDDTVNTFIEMNVVCVADRKGSTLYANGVLSTYDLKKSGNSASVGISAVGSISLPIGQSADSLVKIAEETIEDKAFYGRFFAAVGHVLKEMEERPEEDEAPRGETSPTAAKAAPEVDIPLEQGPVTTPAPGPIPPQTTPATSTPQPVVVPEPGASSPAPVSTVVPTPTEAAPSIAAPAPVQGFSVAAPASLPHAEPAPQPNAATVTAPASQPTAAPATVPAPAPTTPAESASGAPASSPEPAPSSAAPVTPSEPDPQPSPAPPT